MWRTRDGDTGQEYLKEHHYGKCSYQHIESTSFDVGGPGCKLVEPCHLKGISQDIGLGGTDVEVADD